MTVHKEGHATIFSSLVLVTTFNLTMGYFFNFHVVAQFFIASISMAFFGLIVWFFRVPQRKVHKSNQVAYCPADGKVVVIEQVFESEYLHKECIQVSIFMSPLNVHINYFPVSGEVVYTKYHPGKYLVAWHPKSSTENERTTTVIKTAKGKEILIRQIAGAVARRVVNYARLGQTAEQGEQLGFIKFGSRVDVFLPLDAQVSVEMEQVVQGNVSMLAEI
ncbi:MAG: phosphatidylserine decarboxylase family protein [Bacteroidales bacterium]|nr:phosphatidylserine decarboxylase family protein [Bacteroidales bacterium]